ncbi:MAG: PD40 domain-containing protein, partial [Chitinophagaceae bacterium]|nr:PD40 domain-containing protein [Chitinophagaceae bacterium]
MRLIQCIFLLSILLQKQISAQTYPNFGAEIPVTINGLVFDAMEPSISADGNTIFFNSLNDGITTSLYYASRVDDSTFTFMGALTGANQSISPRLDAVASSDSANRFYWTSLRNFPTEFDNCFYGLFNGTDVVNIHRLHGTFYIYTLGWLMMDASINYQGDLLYYTNANFGPSYTGCNGVPCMGKIGIAQKLNDSTFNKLTNSDDILQHINDTNYVVYAPNVSNDGLELYYTRFLKSNLSQGTEICVSVRTHSNDTFSIPSVLHPFSNLTPEATTLTSDQTKIYYHKKSNGLYKLFLRYRNQATSLDPSIKQHTLFVYPNPTRSELQIDGLQENLIRIKIYDL